MIFSWAKLLNTTPDYILYDISYQNLILFSAAAPSYDDVNDKEDEDWDDSIDANNPDNFNNGTDEEETV